MEIMYITNTIKNAFASLAIVAMLALGLFAIDASVNADEASAHGNSKTHILYNSTSTNYNDCVNILWAKLCNTVFRYNGVWTGTYQTLVFPPNGWTSVNVGGSWHPR